ncbi:MAG: isoleucine--tRNA ligase [Deltaproteobacteria bacterium]|nr:isoleucine--tRNA ligase [Deltaproteobacteria bacterium]
MHQKVDSWFDLVALEHEVLKFWDEHRAFDRLREKNAHGPIWSFLDGPITANNPMGIHHAWGRTLKDAYQRYQAMNGKRLRYQNGFDCQGLWVEVEVEKELGFATKRDIENYGIDRFVEKCKERVRKYSAVQTAQSIRLGYWMDWNDSYYTMSDENNYTIWTFLKKCHDRGLIYKGHDVMPWCTRCGTGLSQHEMHEGYKTVKDTSIFARFPIVGREGEYFLVWTTTPWTLSSNTAIAVNPKLRYAKVRQGDAVYYLAEGLVASVVGRKGAHEVIETMPGSAFEGWLYRGPYDENANQKVDGAGHPVVFWDEVAATDGTGIVHIAPGCGKEDFELGKQYGLPVIAPIDDLGVFGPGFGYLTGKNAAQVESLVIDDFKSKGILFATEKYEHSYPHCWRCKTPLLFRAVDEWFIAMDAWREEIKDVARQIRWIPGYGLDLELDWLGNMRDWMISKKRYWGLALPIWVCDSCGHFDVIGGLNELRERAIAGWDGFDGKSPHRPFIDAVKIACAKCGHAASRIGDVGNPWLDAGIVAYSTTHYNANRDEWKKWVPADLVLECFPGQFRNWFYALLAMSTMMENQPPFKTLLGHALVRDEHGAEMHKSAGNAVWFDDAAEHSGVDVLRWLYCRHETTTNLNFGYAAAKEIRGRFINTFWNTYAFYVNYARIANYDPGARPQTHFADRPPFDRWILDRLAVLIERTRKGFDDYNLRAGVLAAEEFVEELSNWYIRNNRRRFWGEIADADTRMAFDTLFTCVETLTRLVAPIMPFLTEHIYQNLVRAVHPDAPDSIHHLHFPHAMPEWRDAKLADEMGALERITHLMLSAREGAKLRVRQPLASIAVGPQSAAEAESFREHEAFLREQLNVKAIRVAEPGTPSPATITVKPNFKTLGKKLGPKMKAFAAALETDAELRAKALEQAASFTMEFEGAEFEFEKADFLVEQRSPENTFVAADAFNWVSLDTVITPELEREGLMRDILRNLQMLRKDAGLEIEDRCAVVYHIDGDMLREVVREWGEVIAEELLCTSFTEGDPGDDSKELKIASGRMRVRLAKAEAVS